MTINNSNDNQVVTTDHYIVAAIWGQMQELLALDHVALEAYLRQLTGMLPSLQTIPVRDAPSIACLHLQSASHLQATMPLIAPQAFAAIQSADAAALADESPTAADLVAKVTEIQLFHLTRVRAVSTYMRAHNANRERQAADAAPNGPDTEMTSRSQEVANSTGRQEEPRSMH